MNRSPAHWWLRADHVDLAFERLVEDIQRVEPSHAGQVGWP